MTPGQMGLLFHLAQDGTAKVSDLSDRLGITPGAVTGMVDKLEEQGLVERVRIRNDRRVVHVRLTDAGRRHVEQVRARFMRLLGDAFRGFPAARVAEMGAVVNAIADALECHFEGENRR
ncbi:MarR family winged helix-turn-helix transcriptional regulator [Calditerricola satsumensis]|uniref:MarR family winged helix-turn-helix transcriptional regulator n=1 Tax=Calditerricola satsumensis TaxID=373054 RepID=UPI00155DD62E|nr:MarR family transcriptional regulator [Calditerricola satsumensis]